MPEKTFSKPFTQQLPLSEEAIQNAVEVLRGGRLHRYNVVEDEVAHAPLLEQEYAVWQGSKYCLAVTSGGQALQIALRAVGVEPGDPILANAYTLAPVPGAMHAVGAKVVLVEIDDNWHIDLKDLERKASESGARYLLLSHMRGQIADMEAICDICNRLEICLIEDCAHTMGATWKGIRSGNFGKVACFSTQTYKHLNSGEGGFLTTDDHGVAARAVIMSGSYMLYESHLAAPSGDAFGEARLHSPNCSARLDNLRASILRPQLAEIDVNIKLWNERWQVLAEGFRNIHGIYVPDRAQHEHYVGSSFQFQVVGIPDVPNFVVACAKRGVEVKWFGSETPHGFTSRYDSWKYLGVSPDLPQTRKILAKTCDLRIPLTFSIEDCRDIIEIVDEVTSRLAVSD